jgi:hypothetical protein
MIIKSAINRRPSHRVRELFPDGCCRKGTIWRIPGMLFSVSPWEMLVSKDKWKNPAGPRHVRAIAVAKGFQHHLLFPGNAAKEQNPEASQARETGNPIRQQQCLGNSPQPKCRIHRVSNSPVNPFRHQFVILPHIETDRPIPSERTVRQVKHAQSRNRNEKSEPCKQRLETVSGETRNSRANVDERHKSESCERCKKQRSFQLAASAPYNPYTP